MIKQLVWLVALVTASMNVELSALEPYSPKALGFELIADAGDLISPFSSTNEEIVSVKMLAEEPSVVPGKAFWVAIQFDMSPEWHLYWRNPGDAGQSPTIHWMLPPGFRVADLLWPAPERIEIEQSVIYGYSNQLILLAQIFPPQDLQIGSTVAVKANIDWFGCNTVCIPGMASFDVKLPVTELKSVSSNQVVTQFKQARKNLPHDSRLAKAKIKDTGLELRVHQDVPFGNVLNAYFFMEQPEILDTHLTPVWEVSADKKTLILKVPTDKLTQEGVIFPLKGIVVVQEETSVGPRTSSWNIRAANPKSQDPTSNFEKKHQAVKNVQSAPVLSVDEHLQALENEIWYRRLLTSLSEFMKSEFAKILLWAFLGGMLLNVMPCVLPVISFKLLHFVQLKGYSRSLVAKHGVMYSFGVLLSFWLLSGAIYLLQSFGHVIGWGFQLQEPIFVAAMIIVLFILSLSLFGVFEFGVSVSSATGAWEQSFAKRIPTASEEPSYLSSFASGVLATFVAAPCTGPLLGSAIGFAATLQPTYSFAIFSALGLGMAFPFLLISLFPGLTKFLPKPGRWMLTFKQLMGFFMLATVLWLVWVLDAQTVGMSNLLLLLSFFVIGFAVWIYGNWCGFDRNKNTRLIGKIAALIVFVAGSWFFISNVQKARINAQNMAAAPEASVSQVVGKDWEPFSLPRLQRLVEKGIPVFVDVTAKWCLTCQTNHLVLESDKVKEAFIAFGVVKMKADWTMSDENITRYIRSLGRNGVPVYVVYGKDAKAHPEVLPEVITPEIVLEALKKAHESN